jgi:transient receptor potential cation channel subfamily M protein 3
MYWYLRILKFMVVNKYLGPLVTIIGKMLQSMIYFIVILLVVLLSAGVCRQAILHPDKEPSWSLVLEIFMEPYLMLFGEVFAESVNLPCGDGPDMKKCEAGVWITTLQMGVYLLVGNILLINLLIGIFDNIFNKVRGISHQIWMFQRFKFVEEYKQKPVLPAPLIMLCHMYLLLKYCYRKVCGTKELDDNALKLFLDHDGLERLRDFEQECMEGYFRKQEAKLHFPDDECIRNIAERVDKVYQKVEDIKQKENNPTSAIREAKAGIRNLEDLTNQTLSNLEIIHQFMVTDVQDP